MSLQNDTSVKLQVEKFIKENTISRKGIEFYFSNKYNEQQKILLKNILDNTYENNNTNIRNSTEKGVISIIITTYNRKKMLIEAIESILSQTYRFFEVIIIDDNSNDGTDLEIKQLYSNDKRIIYYNTRINQGPGINRLIGYKKSKGDYIIFMDDDDYFLDDNYFIKCINVHFQNNDISFVAANSFIYYEDRKEVKISKLNLPYKINRDEYFLNFQTKKYPKPSSTFTAMFKRSVLEEVGLENMNMVNDSSIYLRALMSKGPILLPDIVGVYRVHGNNITYSCTWDFILKNIEEKLNVKKLSGIKFDYSEDIISEWFHRQLDTTLYYYLGNSVVTFKEYREVIKWLNLNDVNYYKKNKFKLLRTFLNRKLRNIKVYNKRSKVKVS